MARSLPNLGLEGFFGLGEDGWNDEMDNNLLKLSTLVQAGAINSVSVLPSTPSQGDVYIVNEAAAINPNTLAVRDDGQWVYLTPQSGWLIYNRFLGQYVCFNGTVWEILSTSGGSGGGGSPQRWELNFSPLTNEPPVENYATLDTRNNRPVLDFDDSDQEAAIWSSKMPDIYAGAGLLVEIFFAASTATSGAVVWDATIERMNLSNLDLDLENFATPVLSDAINVSANSGELSRAFVFLTDGAQIGNLEAGELFRFRVRRVAQNPADTMIGDAELVAVYLKEPLTSAGSSFGLVLTKTDLDENLLNSDVSSYARYTAFGAKTLTVRSETEHVLLASGEWHIRNAASDGDLTIVAGSGVTIHAPNGGTLIVPPRGTVTLKKVGQNVLDLVGQTVPA